MELGKEIRRRREALGWSQPELAAKVGAQQQVVSRLELGESTNSQYLEPILRVLDDAEGSPVAEAQAIVRKLSPRRQRTAIIQLKALEEEQREAGGLLFQEEEDPSGGGVSEYDSRRRGEAQVRLKQ